MTDPLTPWQRVEAALAVLAVDPAGAKGLWLRSRAGALRDLVTGALPAASRVHPGIEDSSLFGGIDLAGTLATGHLRSTVGVLAQSTTVLLTMAERAPAGLAARIARWLDDTGSCLIALDEGVEPGEALPNAIADRLGLFLSLEDMVHSEAEPFELLPERISKARALLPLVHVDTHARESLALVAASIGIDSMRAPLNAVSVARALAAWRGETEPSKATLRHAAELTMAHRGDLKNTSDLENSSPSPHSHAESEQTVLEKEQQQARDRFPDEVLLEAVRSALPVDLLARLAEGRAARAALGSGGTGVARKGNHRGRPLPPLPGAPGSGKRIDLVATLRAASPWQAFRRREVGHDRLHLEIRKSDLRLKRYEETSDRVLVFAVDASGSAALSRLAEAKGAIEILLAHAYARRDHVALIAFRGQGAELLLPPTRSLVQTKRRLAGLPGGGGTPLAAGLRVAFDVSLQVRSRGMTPTIALLTDGRGNVALDGSTNRDTAEADSLRLARLIFGATIPALVIDIANRPQPALNRIAKALGAHYLPLPRADAHRLSTVLQTALGG